MDHCQDLIVVAYSQAVALDPRLEKKQWTTIWYSDEYK